LAGRGDLSTIVRDSSNLGKRYFGRIGRRYKAVDFERQFVKILQFGMPTSGGSVRRSLVLFLSAIALLTAVWIGGCASESSQTQQLYTDAKKLWDDINQAFTLPGRSPERVEMMNKILSEKWDLQLVQKLQDYLKQAPNGKYAKEAADLLDQARRSDKLRMLAQVRPMLEQQGGIPKTAAEADTAAIKMRQQQSTMKADSTAKPAVPSGQ
jgi:hypothetical protein